jgi:hypothetical protein
MRIESRKLRQDRQDSCLQRDHLAYWEKINIQAILILIAKKWQLSERSST